VSETAKEPVQILTAGLPDVSVNEVADFFGANRREFRKQLQQLNDARGGGLLWAKSTHQHAKLWTRWALIRELFPSWFDSLPEPTALDVIELRQSCLSLGNRVGRLERARKRAV
jgi:hypothetical protein